MPPVGSAREARARTESARRNISENLRAMYEPTTDSGENHPFVQSLTSELNNDFVLPQTVNFIPTNEVSNEVIGDGPITTNEPRYYVTNGHLPSWVAAANTTQPEPTPIPATAEVPSERFIYSPAAGPRLTTSRTFESEAPQMSRRTLSGIREFILNERGQMELTPPPTPGRVADFEEERGDERIEAMEEEIEEDIELRPNRGINFDAISRPPLTKAYYDKEEKILNDELIRLQENFEHLTIEKKIEMLQQYDRLITKFRKSIYGDL